MNDVNLVATNADAQRSRPDNRRDFPIGITADLKVNKMRRRVAAKFRRQPRSPMKRLRTTTLILSQLEGRITPAVGTTLTWQGDISNQWGGGTSGTNTNWSSTPSPNKLPVRWRRPRLPDRAGGELDKQQQHRRAGP